MTLLFISQKTISLVKYNRGRHRGRGAEIYPNYRFTEKKTVNQFKKENLFYKLSFI
jgi:hypothetical protein